MLLEYHSSIEVKGEILDPLGRFGNFLYFNEFDDPYPLPPSQCYAFNRLPSFELLLHQIISIEEKFTSNRNLIKEIKS